MKLLGSLLVLMLSLLVVVPSSALDITDPELAGLSWTHKADALDDHSGGAGFSIYGMSCAIDSGYLYISVHTDFPEAGLSGSDSYGSNLFNPGDLYLNVGGSFQAGDGTEYGVATTTHGNNVTQAYSTWGADVTKGGLYSYDSAEDISDNTTPEGMFADGTLESYQASNPTYDPDDGDSIAINSYPTAIRYGAAVAGDNSGVRYIANVGDAWDYDIVYKVDLSAIGYNGSESLQAFWAMECGNDGVEITKEVPEPTTIALITAGFSAMAVRRRKRLG